MKTYLDCIPCFMQQALNAGRVATNNETQIKQILDKTGNMIKFVSMEATPAEIGLQIYQIVREVTGVFDPYKQLKQKHINEAKSLLQELNLLVEKSDDKLLTAIKIAIAGNVIDMGVNKSFDILNDIKYILQQDLAISDIDIFKKQLLNTDIILYIGDNAGESVFDKILIQKLNKPVIYAVRSIPIINDVTMEDAIASGLNDVAEIIDSGSKAPGIILNQCTPEFIKIFNQAGLVISKGQGNYEGLSDCNRQIFFLLKAKCSIISKDLNVNINDIVLKTNIKEN